MAEPKTKPGNDDVTAFLSRVEPEKRRTDGAALDAMMQKITGSAPKLWGASLIGYGAYTSTGSNNKPTQWPVTAFSPRKTSLVLYIMPGFEPYADLLARLGKYKTGKSCLYINRLDDVDLDVLEQIVAQSVADMQKKYPTEM